MGQPLMDDDRVARRLGALVSWYSDWSGLRAAVFGLGKTGFSVTDTLVELGADVLVVTDSADVERAMLVEVIGARLHQEAGLTDAPDVLREFDPELVVVSPGLHPDNPLIVWARSRGIPIWGDIELAWRV
jgi:UDP-N-acetylmuramoylalanine--D-glutamate ligase